MTISTRLYYLSQSSSAWRRAAYLLHRKGGCSDATGSRKHRRSGLELGPEVKLELRDHLADFRLPREAWIDFRIIETWVRCGLPIPLVVSLDHILSKQRPDGSWSTDLCLPNSGATYRSIELWCTLGLEPHDNRIQKAIDYLARSLVDGALRSPGPVPGALPEVGTTARCLHVFSVLDTHSHQRQEMTHWLLSRLHEEENLACWHTDAQISRTQDGVVGATSLALHALLRHTEATGTPFSQHDRLNKAARWLVAQANPADGGWPDTPGNPSNIDNTFNALRALHIARDHGLLHGDNRLTEALAAGHRYASRESLLDSSDPAVVAMTLRARLLFASDPYDPGLVACLDRLAQLQGAWYHPHAHLYNQLLVCSLAIAEWLRLARSRENPYSAPRSSVGLRFLFDFPTKIPPFYPGHRGGLYEALLDTLVTTRLQPLAELVERTLALREAGAMALGLLLFFTVYVDSDLIRVITVKDGSPWLTTPFWVAYALWLGIKWRLRPSTQNFIATTFFSWIFAFFLIFWLHISLPPELAVPAPGAWTEGSLWRLATFFALALDIGRRLIHYTHLDRIFDERSAR